MRIVYYTLLEPLKKVPQRQNGLNVLHKALHNIGLQINPTKITSMIFSPRKRDIKLLTFLAVFCINNDANEVGGCMLVGLVFGTVLLLFHHC
jgi:hypothetical protein